jgi:V8-like Glu-specific endopeptidase/ankyrin repeat protein
MLSNRYSDAEVGQLQSLMAEQGGSADEKRIRAMRESLSGVCQIRVRKNFGTGFLFLYEGLDCVMTNHHVINTPLEASDAECVFFFFSPEDAGVAMKLDVDSFFYTNKQLDCTIVAVQFEDLINSPRLPFHLKLSSRDYKKDETVVVIGHPDGQPVSITAGKVLEDTSEVDNILRHDANTQLGSSGSPVLDVNGHVFALHNKGFAATNGAILIRAIMADIDGQSFTKYMEPYHASLSRSSSEPDSRSMLPLHNRCFFIRWKKLDLCLQAASLKMRCQLISWLLNQNVPASAALNEDGTTFLHLLAQSSDEFVPPHGSGSDLLFTSVLRELFRHKCRLEAIAYSMQWTAFHVACRCGNLAFFRTLGALKNTVDKVGMSLSAAWDKADVYGNTPAYYAVEYFVAHSCSADQIKMAMDTFVATGLDVHRSCNSKNQSLLSVSREKKLTSLNPYMSASRQHHAHWMIPPKYQKGHMVADYSALVETPPPASPASAGSSHGTNPFLADPTGSVFAIDDSIVHALAALTDTELQHKSPIECSWLLYSAIHCKDCEQVNRLLRLKPSCASMMIPPFDDSPLNCAVRVSDVNIVRALLDAGVVDPLLCGRWSLNALQTAAAIGAEQVLQILLEFCDSDKTNALVASCAAGLVDLAATHGRPQCLQMSLRYLAFLSPLEQEECLQAVRTRCLSNPLTDPFRAEDVLSILPSSSDTLTPSMRAEWLHVLFRKLDLNIDDPTVVVAVLSYLGKMAISDGSSLSVMQEEWIDKLQKIIDVYSRPPFNCEVIAAAMSVLQIYSVPPVLRSVIVMEFMERIGDILSVHEFAHDAEVVIHSCDTLATLAGNEDIRVHVLQHPQQFMIKLGGLFFLHVSSAPVVQSLFWVVSQCVATDAEDRNKVLRLQIRDDGATWLDALKVGVEQHAQETGVLLKCLPLFFVLLDDVKFRDQLLNEKWLTTLKRVFDRNVDKPLVIEKVFQLLRRLMEYQEGSARVMEEDWLSILRQAFDNNFLLERIVEQVFASLSLVARNESGRKLIAIDWLQAIIRGATQHISSEIVVASALATLHALADDSYLRRRLVDDGCLEFIHPVLTRHSHNAGIVETICTILRLIATDKSNRKQLLELRVPKVLKDSFDRFVENERIVEQILLTVMKLGEDAGDRVVLLDDVSWVTMFKHGMQKHFNHEELMGRALTVLCFILAEKDDRILHMLSSSSFHWLEMIGAIFAAHKLHATVVEKALIVLVRLVEYGLENPHAVLDLWLPLLMDVLCDHPRQQGVVAQVFMILTVLAVDHGSRKRIIASLQSWLMSGKDSFLQYATDTVFTHAFDVLTALSADHELKVSIIQEGFLDLVRIGVTRVAKSSQAPAEVMEKAFRVLRVLIVDCSDVVTLLEQGIPELLLNGLHDHEKHGKVVVEILSSMARFTRDEHVCKTLVSQGWMRLLHQVIENHPSDKHVCHLAFCCASGLVKSLNAHQVREVLQQDWVAKVKESLSLRSIDDSFVAALLSFLQGICSASYATQKIFEARLSDVLRNILMERGHSVPILENIVAVISALASSGDDGMRKRMVREGWYASIHECISGLRQTELSSRLVCVVLDVLCALALTAENKFRLVEDGCYSWAVQLYTPYSKEAACEQKLFRLLQRLAENDASASSLVGHNVFGLLRTAYDRQSQNISVVKDILTTLTALSGTDGIRFRLVRSGALRLLRDALSAHIGYDIVIVHVFDTLALLAKTPDVAQEIVQQGWLFHLKQAYSMYKHNDEIVQLITQTMCSISPMAGVREVLADDGWMPMLERSSTASPLLVPVKSAHRLRLLIDVISVTLCFIPLLLTILSSASKWWWIQDSSEVFFSTSYFTSFYLRMFKSCDISGSSCATAPYADVPRQLVANTLYVDEFFWNITLLMVSSCICFGTASIVGLLFPCLNRFPWPKLLLRLMCTVLVTIGTILAYAAYFKFEHDFVSDVYCGPVVDARAASKFPNSGSICQDTNVEGTPRSVSVGKQEWGSARGLNFALTAGIAGSLLTIILFAIVYFRDLSLARSRSRIPRSNFDPVFVPSPASIPSPNSPGFKSSRSADLAMSDEFLGTSARAVTLLPSPTTADH